MTVDVSIPLDSEDGSQVPPDDERSTATAPGVSVEDALAPADHTLGAARLSVALAITLLLPWTFAAFRGGRLAGLPVTLSGGLVSGLLWSYIVLPVASFAAVVVSGAVVGPLRAGRRRVPSAGAMAVGEGAEGRPVVPAG